MSRHLSTGSLSLKKQLELAAPWLLTGAFLSTEVNTVELGPPLSRAYDRFWGTSPALGAAPRILNEAPCPPGCPASGAPQGWPGPFSSNPLSLQGSSWATWSTPCPPFPGFKAPVCHAHCPVFHPFSGSLPLEIALWHPTAIKSLYSMSIMNPDLCRVWGGEGRGGPWEGRGEAAVRAWVN